MLCMGLLKSGDRLVDRRGHCFVIGREDLTPDRGIRTGNTGPVAQAGCQGTETLCSRAPLGRQLIGENMGQVAYDSHRLIVFGRIDCHGFCAQTLDQLLQAIEQDPFGIPGRGQVPAGTLVEISPGVGDSRRLGPGQGMAADEAWIAPEGFDQFLLGRTDIGDHTIGRGGVEGLLPHLDQMPDRGAADDHIGIGAGLFDRGGHVVDRPDLEAFFSPLGTTDPAGDFGQTAIPGCEADRASDQPDTEDGQFHFSCL